jgi:uncharacterized protein (TIGR02145 family)
MKKSAWICILISFILSITLSITCRKEGNATDYTYLNKYVGDWEFKVYFVDPRNDTSYTYTYNGSIRYSSENKLDICYNENGCLIKSVDKEGQIFGNSTNSIGEFDGDNRIHICLSQGPSIPPNPIIDISGQKLDGTPIPDLSPLTTTSAATGLTLKGALLNGKVHGNCLYTNVYFEFGISTSYGETFNASDSYSISRNTVKTSCINKDIRFYVVGLAPDILYHYRVKAVNSNGTSYGSDVTVTTSKPTDPVTDLDGNIYNTVPIGNQIWMAGNLKTTHYNDGTRIPLVQDAKAWINLTTPGYCWYNNDSVSNKNNFGALYNWYCVSTGKLCPYGWHVPTNDEWITLSNSLDGPYDVGSKLQATGIANWSLSFPETNVTGFTALPGGYREFGNYDGLNITTRWWSATEYVTLVGSFVTYYDYQLKSQSPFKEFGNSVRCLKDE